MNEGSAIHQLMKGLLGSGAKSILEDCTVITSYFRGTTNKVPWQVEAPRRVFGIITELLEIHMGEAMWAVHMGRAKPDISGYSRGAMTVISFVRQVSPYLNISDHFMSSFLMNIMTLVESLDSNLL